MTRFPFAHFALALVATATLLGAPTAAHAQEAPCAPTVQVQLMEPLATTPTQAQMFSFQTTCSEGTIATWAASGSAGIVASGRFPDAASGQSSWMAGVGAEGTYQITVSLIDGAGQTTASAFATITFAAATQALPPSPAILPATPTPIAPAPRPERPSESAGSDSATGGAGARPSTPLKLRLRSRSRVVKAGRVITLVMHLTGNSDRVCVKLPKGFTPIKAKGLAITPGKACWSTGGTLGNQTRTMRLRVAAKTKPRTYRFVGDARYHGAKSYARAQVRVIR